jgi:hypothetical protein
VALPDEDRRGKHRADLREERAVGEQGPGASSGRNPRLGSSLRAVPLDGGTCQSPCAADALDAVGLLGGW